MDRRTCLKLTTATAASAFFNASYGQTFTSAAPAFNEERLDGYVQELASRPYVAPERRLDDTLQNVTYEQYRDNIVFKPENAIWREESLEFRLDLYQTAGSFFSFPVDISIVENGNASPVVYSQQYFSFLPPLKAPAANSQSGFAGFRVRSPINGDPTIFDDLMIFLGASFFKAAGSGQSFGLSSCRGLAINTGQSSGEEFPLFRAFWIEKPKPGQKTLVIHAVLDSVSAAGRYKFMVTPGKATAVEIEATLYPRKRLPYLGIAPVTGMFFFAPHAPAKRRDIRPRAHDIEGLSIFNGAGEWIWRPVVNPERLQFSVFLDKNPKGFGLAQRDRAFSDYQDLSAAYEKRPSTWIEPLGEWGEGSVDLIELPASDDAHDNVIAFWRPKDGLAPQPQGHKFRYKLTFGLSLPATQKAAVVQTRLGDNRNGEPQFVIDFHQGEDGQLVPPSGLTPTVSASSGEIRGAALAANPNTGGYRLSFVYTPPGNQTADLRAVLMAGTVAASETWLFRWAR